MLFITWVSSFLSLPTFPPSPTVKVDLSISCTNRCIFRLFFQNIPFRIIIVYETFIFRNMKCVWVSSWKSLMLYAIKSLKKTNVYVFHLKLNKYYTHYNIQNQNIPVKKCSLNTISSDNIEHTLYLPHLGTQTADILWKSK